MVSNISRWVAPLLLAVASFFGSVYAIAAPVGYVWYESAQASYGASSARFDAQLAQAYVESKTVSHVRSDLNRESNGYRLATVETEQKGLGG